MQNPSRKGSPPLALQTLVDRIAKKKTAAEVRVNEALDAARTLQQDPRTRVARYRNAALTGGTLNPVVRGIGRAAERMATAPRGQRLAAGAKGFMSTNRGELAKHVVEGAAGGGGIRAVQEGLEVGQAKKKVTKFLNQPEPKIAEHEHYRNKCPECGSTQQCRCDSTKKESSDVCGLCKEKTAAKGKGGALSHLVKAHWRRKKASLGEHLAQEVSELTGHRKLSGAEIRAALRSVAKVAAEKKPAQSRLPLKPVASPDLDFEV